MTWMVVGFAVVLGAASILEQRLIGQRDTAPAIAPVPAIEPMPAKPKPGEPGRSLVVARRGSALDQ